MRIPAVATRTTAHAIASAVMLLSKNSGKDKGSDSQLQQWSSLIGIVTAIVGNILISFALNTQRYAHMRLEREHNDSKNASSANGQQLPRKIQGYGATQQEDLAEERSRLNAMAPGPGQRKVPKEEQGDSQDANENTPLKNSFESDETTTHDEKDEEEDGDGRKSYLKSPYWWLGIVMMTVGEAGNFLAYGFAPASIVSPLGVVALIVNCVIAPFMLKENFRARDGWGVLVAIAGAVTVVLSAKQTEKKMGPDDLWEAIRRWEFLTYIGITAGFIILFMALSPRYGSRTVLIDLGLVGLFGGYTALSTKGVASMLSVSLWHAFTFPITYFLVVVLVISAVLQIRYVNKALQNFNSTQVIPTQFVMFTISVVVGSAVLYREFESVTVGRMIKFVAGCLLTFIGVYLITSGPRKGQSADDEDEEEHEVEGIHLLDEEGTHTEVTPMSKRPGTYDSLPRPVTPVRKEPADEDQEEGEGEDEELPSIAGTPEPSSSSSILNHNQYISSTDHLDDTTQQPQPPIFPRTHSELPKTPQFRHLQFETASSTPYYTPESTHQASRHTLQRTISSTPNPETPTKSKRTPSPPKPDPPLRPSPTPNSLARSARGSITRLLPGPFMVSTSLSGVVADSLRKEEGRTSLRRRRSSRAERRSSVAVDEEMGHGQDVAEIVEGDGSAKDKKGRLRVVSGGVGGLMKKMKRRGDNNEEGEGDGQEEGGGPS